MIWLIVFAGLVVYVAMFIFTWGGIFAWRQADWENPKLAEQYRRMDLAHSAMFALIPLFWFMAPFLTGFYQAGWNLPFVRRNGGRR